MDRYFECTGCKAVVQGWNAATWYGRWHEAGCLGGDIIEIDGPAKFEPCNNLECNHLGCEQAQQEV